MIREDFTFHDEPVATQYVVLEIEGRPEVVIDRVRQEDGSFKYAVRDGFRQCYSNAKSGGTWSFERMPSSRPSNWIKRYRFDSLEEAFAGARRGAKKKLKDYRERVRICNERHSDGEVD